MDPIAFDLFCRVVDNYGDAGVCWRLARQLAARGHAVRLWLDDRAVLARLVPGLDPRAPVQRVERVEVAAWDLAQTATPPRIGVVIEAFACELPPAYRARMAEQRCLWINLEYLSAERWVEGCHGLPSPQENGVPKYFYFPGFTPATGGLLREPGLFEQAARARQHDRRARLAALTAQRWDDLPAAARCVLLFGYRGAPVAGLQRALADAAAPTWLLIPEGSALTLHDEGSLHVRRIPFIPQARFDELLGCCDLNVVRGEDSVVRATWAARPAVWQIYPQAHDAHLDKLEAWMDRAQWPAAVRAVQRAWNGHDADTLARALTHALAPDPWQVWQARSREWARELAAQPDLASSLVAFCQRKRQNLQTR